MDKPIVFLAFSDARSDLPGLRAEGWSLKDQFTELKQRGVIADVVVEERASLERIVNIFRRHHHRIAIFHFGGHADDDRLLLEAALEPQPAHAEGLATLLGQQSGLKLVFLNGCSTRPQVKRLLVAGVPAVIATARPIEDAVATEFAVAFYQALTTGPARVSRQIAPACSLATAFDQALGLVKATRGGNPRDMVVAEPLHDDITDDDGFPWSLQYRKGAEHVARWSLFEDEPLFGLPDLPDDIGWPPEPYRNLEHFHREHARIFFGRGRAIRELHDLVTRPATPRSASVLLYYGQTGVGKTSVLAAGLLPRLEAAYQIRYLRRDAEKGLLGTVLSALGSDASTPDLSRLWREAEHRDAGRPLLVVLDQAEEAFTRPATRLLSEEGTSSPARAGHDPQTEVPDLFSALKSLFDPPQGMRPRGRIILGFRKEWLDEFEAACRGVNLSYESLPLNPLDRGGVIEAVRGPASEPDLSEKRARYRLTIADEAPSLPEFLADDLLDTLADPGVNLVSPVAPTLQMLLTRMWGEARQRDRDGPTFDRRLYTELKQQAFRLGEVLDQQLGAIAYVDREAVEQGLVLDLLNAFTTSLGTAASLTSSAVRERYPGLETGRLYGLLEQCKGHYLLAEVGHVHDGIRTYRLTHDTLAPLVRERYQISTAPIPRLRRAVDNKTREWVASRLLPGGSEDRGQSPPGRHTLLEPHDLEIIPRVGTLLPQWTNHEQELINASRAEHARRQAEEDRRANELSDARQAEKDATIRRLKEQQDANRRLRNRAKALLAATTATLVFAGLAGWQWHEASNSAVAAKAQTKIAQGEKKRAEAQTKSAQAEKKRADERAAIAESRRLAVLSDSVRPDRLDLGLLLALEAMREPTPESRGCLLRALDTRPEVDRFLHVVEGEVTSVAFGPDGQLAAGYSAPGRGDGGGVVLFDARGERVHQGPLLVEEGRVGCVAIGPDGQIAAAFGTLPPPGRQGLRSCVVLFDARGERVRQEPLLVEEGVVSNVTFGPAGQFAVIIDELFSHEAGRMVLFDARGERVRQEPLLVEEGRVTSVTFGMDGQIVAAYTYIGFQRDRHPSGVVLFDSRGERLGSKPLVIKEGVVSCVKLGPEGQIAAGYARDARGGVVLFDAKGEPLRPELLDVPEGIVKDVAFGPEGQIAAAYLTAVGRDGFGMVNTNDIRGVVLFDARGERLHTDPLVVKEGAVSSVAVGPRAKIAMGYKVHGPRHATKGNLGGGVALLDVRGQRLRSEPLAVQEGLPLRVAVGPEEQIALVYMTAAGRGTNGREWFDADKRGVVLFDARGKRLFVKEGPAWSVGFGPHGQIAVGFGAVRDGGSVVLFDSRGERLGPGPLVLEEGMVMNVAFGEEGQIAAGYFDYKSLRSGVALFDAQDRLPHAKVLEVEKAMIQDLAFGLDAQIVAAYKDGDNRIGIVVVDNRGQRLRSTSLTVQEGGVTKVAFGPGGQIAAGYREFGRAREGIVLLNAQGQRICTEPLSVAEGSIACLAYGSKGRIAVGFRANAGRQGVVHLDVDSTSWSQKAIRTANRNLTWEEWALYLPDTPYQRTSRTLPWPHDLPHSERKRAEVLE